MARQAPMSMPWCRGGAVVPSTCHFAGSCMCFRKGRRTQGDRAGRHLHCPRALALRGWQLAVSIPRHPANLQSSILPSARRRERHPRCSGLDLTQDLFPQHSAAALIPGCQPMPSPRLRREGSHRVPERVLGENEAPDRPVEIGRRPGRGRLTRSTGAPSTRSKSANMSRLGLEISEDEKAKSSSGRSSCHPPTAGSLRLNTRQDG